MRAKQRWVPQAIGLGLAAVVFVAGIPVVLGWLGRQVPALLVLLVPLVPISIALGLWRRRW